MLLGCNLPPVPAAEPSEEGAVVGLAVAALRPSVGEDLRLDVSWSGPWPPRIPWPAEARVEGDHAYLRPLQTGPLSVTVGTFSLDLAVQEAIFVQLPAPEVDLRPLNQVKAGCPEDRLPGLAGPWVIWCEGEKVDRALNVESGQILSFSGPRWPALGPSVVYAPGMGQGLWRLPNEKPDPSVSLVAEGSQQIATDGQVALIGRADRVERLPLDQHFRTLIHASPVPHSPLALAGPVSAWIQDNAQTGWDIWVGLSNDKHLPLSRRLGMEAWLAGSASWLGWVDAEGVVVEDVVQHIRRRYSGDTGFLHPLSLWGPTACWEDRAQLRAGTGDIDLRCSDGLYVKRPGHQTAPWRVGPWLLFQESGRIMLATYRSILLDDSDPRATGSGPTAPGGFGGSHRVGGVSWHLDWPATGWRVEYWRGAWVPGEIIAPGPLDLYDAGGDAIRLVPQ